MQMYHTYGQGWGTKEDIKKVEMNVLMHPYEIFELMFCHKK